MSLLFSMDSVSKRIYELLTEFATTSRNELQALDEIDKKQVEYQKRQKKEMEERLKNLYAQRKRLQVFISISKMYISGSLPIADRMEQFNPDELSRLQVQMNMNHGNQSFARELYRHAVAQQMSVEDRIQYCEHESQNAKDKDLEKDREGIINALNNQLKELSKQLVHLRKDRDNNKLEREKNTTVDTQIGAVICPTNINVQLLKDVSAILGQQMENDSYIADYLINQIEGGCVCLESNEKMHLKIINTVIAVIIRITCSFKERLNQVLYVDPYLLNDAEIHMLTETCAEKKSIIEVPKSKYQISEYIKSFKGIIDHDVSIGNDNVHMCVLHGFPEEYDTECLETIREICFNAERYRTIVMMINNLDSDRSKGIPHQAFPAQYIMLDHGYLKTNLSGDSMDAIVSLAVTPNVSAQQLSFLQRNVYKENLDNRYDNRIKLDEILTTPKGSKRPINLPYAISEHGEILKTNLNFGYLYGVQGSGKSTLLHTLISSIIATMHPDDVELWLIDFKMVEFSRYIRFCPPHVRRVILDSSPEMVFDLLDRLNNILDNRKSRFDENHWHSIQDANREGIYLPAIVVIIDEFPVMSHILADAYEYKEKLEKLMTLGRQFGFYLLLSGQFFSTGLQGLKKEARDQMLWRAAMLGPKDEIKATLELPNVSEHDNSLITKIQSHYTLMKRQQDHEGNFLDYGKVLYFGSDLDGESNQIQWLQKIVENFHCSSVYRQNEQNIYFDKQPAFFDGHSYLSFSSLKKIIQDDIIEHSKMREALLCLYPGQPRCLKNLYAIELRQNLGENLMICSRPQQIDELCSLLLSVVDSCQMNVPKYEVSVVASPKGDNMYRLCDLLEQHTKSVIQDIKSIAAEIMSIYHHIQRGDNGHKILLLLDYPEIIKTICNSSKANPINTSNFVPSSIDSDEDYADIFGAPPSHPGLLSKILQGAPLDPIEDTNEFSVQETKHENQIALSEAIDVILQEGATYGYHVIPVFKTIQDSQKHRRIANHCSHMIFFKASKDDVMLLTKTKEARYIEEMAPYTFRYVGDINGMSYRPYMHEGIEIDGWYQHDDTVERIKAKKGSYLE